MNKPSILFSIIIPTYNRSKFLTRALESIFSQSIDADFEVLIIDDGSTDDTKKTIEAIENPKISYYYQKNQGQSIARNHGVLKAKGANIIFMDDDDYWLPDHLQWFEIALSKSPITKKIFRTGFIRIRQNGDQIKAPNYDPTKHLNPVNFAAFNMCALVTLCIPKEFLVENHSPPGFPHWQDTHLILRLFAKYPFEQLPTHTYIYYIHKNMGSLNAQTEDKIFKRAEINVAAIEDFFKNYKTLVAPFLPTNTLSFLRAEKFIEYTNLELTIGGRKKHWQLLKKSLSSRFDLRLWKHYVLFIKYLIFSKR